MPDRKRILMVSHGHPNLLAGGGEVAAYNLHKALAETQEFDSVFLARHFEADRTRPGTLISGNGNESEILLYGNMSDWFRFSQAGNPALLRHIRELLQLVQPDIIHFHHYLHLGLEFFRIAREVVPSAVLVLTLHEYFGICHNHGKMVRTTDQSRCLKPTPVDCARCFPDYSTQDFYLRERFIKSAFEHIDCLIAPSEFLRERYVEWGVEPDRIKVIENYLPLHNTASSVSVSREKKQLRLAYFGQIHWYKGLDVLIDAVALLPDSMRSQLQLDVYGTGWEQLDAEYRARIETTLSQLGESVHLHGGYSRGQLGALMQKTDWVIVPSRWWENSPLVIQEAAQFGVPVVCSDIGGMAEKVIDGVTGLHFAVDSPDSLASKFEQIVANQDLHRSLANKSKDAVQACDSFERHVNTYRDLFSSYNACLRVA